MRPPHASLIRAWFLRTTAGALVGESGVAAAHAAYRKAYVKALPSLYFCNTWAGTRSGRCKGSSGIIFARSGCKNGEK
jgi:hypothetical protein